MKNCGCLNIAGGNIWLYSIKDIVIVLAVLITCYLTCSCNAIHDLWSVCGLE